MSDILVKLQLLSKEFNKSDLLIKKNINLNEEIKPYNMNDISTYDEDKVQPYNFEYNQLKPNFSENFYLYRKENKDDNEILVELTKKIHTLNDRINEEFKLYNEIKEKSTNDSQNYSRELEKIINIKIIQLNDEINVVNRKLIHEQLIFNEKLKKELDDIEKQIEDNYKTIFELTKKQKEIINKLF
jgi:hypothetical protein